MRTGTNLASSIVARANTDNLDAIAQDETPESGKGLSMTADGNNQLLRIEAINIGGFILDSEDLSTIRGAGLLLLGLHQFLTGAKLNVTKDNEGQSDKALPGTNETEGDWLADGAVPLMSKTNESKGCSTWHVQLTSGQKVTLQMLSVGASVALYEFRASETQATELQGVVSAWLREHPKLRHATFAVAISCVQHGDQSNFPAASEVAIQKVRRQQLRGPAVSPGKIQQRTDDGGRADGAGFCDIDAKRAATVNLKTQIGDDIRTSYATAADKNFASEATHARRAFGRDRKIRVYHLLQQELLDSDLQKQPVANAETADGQKTLSREMFTPAWEFEDIATRNKGRRHRRDPAVAEDGLDRWSVLKGKMAVIYIDGNKFSRQIREAAKDATAYREIDATIRLSRARLMRALTQQMQHEERSYWRVQLQNGRQRQELVDAFRIETLMWGGDEMIWVVPAWCALETVQFFFNQTRDWCLGGNHPPLTHAVGLVLCSHKSPIRSAVRLARELADNAKDLLKPETKDQDKPAYYNGPEANVVAYQVLESFDHLGEDTQAARKRHRFNGMSDSQMILSSQQLNELITHLNTLKNSVRLPQTRLHQIGQFLQRTPLPDTQSGDTEEWSAYKAMIQRVAETVNATRGCRPYQVLMESIQLTSDRRETTTGSADKTDRSTKNQTHTEPLDGQNEATFAGPCESNGNGHVETGLTLRARNAIARWYHVIELWDYLGSMDTSVINIETSASQGKAAEVAS